MINKRVSLLLPGYTPDNPVQVESKNVSAADRVASLSAFRFSEEHEHEPWQSQFSRILGLNATDARRLPTARLALTRLAATLMPTEQAVQQHIVRADPVFLKADRDDAKLTPADHMALSEADADELLHTLNEFVSADRLRFFRNDVSEWYMCGMNAELLESYPPSFIANRNASTFLPGGEAMAPWRRLMTELQMLLHTHPVNQQRESAGLMPVNSVWFWGGGALPANDSVISEVTVYADDVQARDITRYLDVPCRSLSELSDASNDQLLAAHTVILDASLIKAWLDADAELLMQALTHMNNHLLGPLSKQLRSGKLSEISIHTEDGLRGICNAQTIEATVAKRRQDSWLQSLSRLFKR